MLKNANSPVSEDEQMEYTVQSSVTHNPLSGLDTIIQSINKRYEVYLKRRTAITPFSTPAEAALRVPNPPTPRPILSDSAAASASTGGSGSGSGSGATTAKHSTAQLPPRDALAESIVVANAHSAPYWEERELYIVAEDLCCYLNGGVNYRLLCEQYQRALELLLTLVKEDVGMCATGAVEVVPGGTAAVLRKLQGLLQESRKMLEEAGVDVPPKLATMLDQLPVASDEAPFSEPATAAYPSVPSTLITAATTANASGTQLAKTQSSRARPPSALAPTRRQQPAAANGVSGSADPTNGPEAPPQPQRATSGGSVGRRPPQPRTRTSLSTPDSGHLPIHFTFSGNTAAAATSTTASAAAATANGGTGARRNTPSSAVIVDPPEDYASQSAFSDAVNGSLDAHDRHGSILRNTSTSNVVSLPSSSAPTPVSNVSTAQRSKSSGPHLHVAAHPPSDESPSFSRPTPLTSDARKLFRNSGSQQEPGRRDDVAMDCLSPIPSTPPPPPLYAGLLDSQQASLDPQRSYAGAAAGSDATPYLRGRLRVLEELYGEHYAMDGMTLLTDTLGVVFTREYDQGEEQQYQNGFAAFQRDVNAKVMPALKSYDALQLRITELTPLRSAYLGSCLARRVRPNDAVLAQLKRIDHDRAPETLLLGGLHLGDLGTAAVVESIVPRLYRLRTLNLSDNNLHDSVLDVLCRCIRYHPALETLDLSRNPITDGCLTSLSRIAQTVPRLSSITLQSCGISSAAKQMVEAEVASPGTRTVSASFPRRATPTLSRGGSSANNVVGVLPTAKTAAAASSVSAPRAPHPPTAHRPSSSMDGRTRWSPKSSARAESVPSKVSSAVRKPMLTKGKAASNELKLPPLPTTSSSSATK